LKLALTMMVRDSEVDFLRLHLPVIADCFDGLVAVYDEREGIQAAMYLMSIGAVVRHHPFTNSWSAMFNHAIDDAEQLGFDALLRLDPDEVMFARDIEAIRDLLKEYTLLCLSRYTFWLDRLHYTPGSFPDWQARVWLLNKGVRLGGQHHETINWAQFGLHEGDPFADTPRQVLRVPTLAIYHYGGIGRERILERDFHYLNVAREQEGLPPLAERPADRPFPTRHRIVFHGPQPIDPDVCGLYAPYKE
jgi:hypothetical protein